ncbi:MAG: hypothetical protein H0T71_13785 [Acidobacteria bacterium]|nr:hypothetical protein [Acidobacteriota bacterium]
MQAFVESAHEQIDGSAWSADRLATARAMLMRDDAALRDRRVSSGANALQMVPDDQRLVALSRGEEPMVRGGALVFPQEVAYQSAASFLASQPTGRWLAIALAGDASSGFCRDIFDRLGAVDVSSTTGRVVLARLGTRPAATAADGSLEISYGHLVDGHAVPAHFKIETSPAAAITVNDALSGRAATGLVITAFDPWTADGPSWVVGDCRRPVLPTMGDRRLKAALVVESNGGPRLPNVGVLGSVPLTVPMGEDGAAWFGRGWHDAEGPGTNAMRWTSAHEADVNVIASHQQPLRVQLAAFLAARTPGSGGLSASWNGLPLPAPTTNALGQREWTIDKSNVRRGPNVLTLHVVELVSPATLANGTDDRLLGAAVSRVSFIPLVEATKVPPPPNR